MFDCYDINVCVYFFFQAENRIKKFEKLKDFYGDRFETNVIKGQISTFHEVCNFVGFRNNRMNMQIITSRVWCYIKVRNKWIEMKNVIIVILDVSKRMIEILENAVTWWIMMNFLTFGTLNQAILMGAFFKCIIIEKQWPIKVYVYT